MVAFRKTIATASAALLSLTATACAQQQLPTPVAPSQVAVEQVEMSGPAMWMVSDEDTQIFLFGTVHALPPDVEWYSGSVKDALDSADTLVTEIDMTPEAIAGMGPLVASRAIYTDGTTLRGILDEMDRKTFEEGLGKLGLPANALDQIEPWFATLQLAQLALAQAGVSTEFGVEKVLEETIKPGTNRIALETIDGQLAIFDELPLEAQIFYLVETARQIDQVAPSLQTLTDEWASGDAEELGALLNATFEDDPVLAERLLYARNANWADWIAERMDTPGVVFMAVGAGHLAGDKSVQDLLEAKGIRSYRVQ